MAKLEVEINVSVTGISRYCLMLSDAAVALLGDKIGEKPFTVRAIGDLLYVDVVESSTGNLQAAMAPPPEPAPSQDPPLGGKTAAEQEPAKEKEKEEEPLKGGKRAQRAGIVCNEKSFWRWVNDYKKPDQPIQNKDDAADFLRYYTGVKTRAHLDHVEKAGQVFDELMKNYDHWMRHG